MTVVHYEQPVPLPPSLPGDELNQGPKGWVARLRAAAEYANYVGDTDFVPRDLRGNAPAVAAAILYGGEVGLEPMQALRGIAMIRGTPSMRAETQRGLIASRGHELWVEESTVTRAIVAGRRRDSDRIGRVTWTMDDAKRAGLAGQHNYRSYPREMLVARATAALARQMFADVIGGMPATEELEGDTDNGPPVVPSQPAPVDVTPDKPQTRTRRRKTTEARDPVAPTPAPDPQPQPPAESPPDRPLTDAQQRQLFALMRDLELPDRDARLAYTSRIAGRDIQSSNDLTLAEAHRVIEDLNQIALLPIGEERRRRLLGKHELAVLEELERHAKTTAFEPPPDVQEQLQQQGEQPQDDDFPAGF